MSISIGVVGVGSFGQSFIKLFRDHPQVQRIALCDLKPDRLAEMSRKFGVAETYDSIEAVCKSDLDALAIITQPWLHGPQAVAAMECGKHVYSAVPMISLRNGDEMLDWCDKIVDAARRTGQYYMMGETSYYRSQAMYCRRRAAEGAFGHFVLGEGEYFHDVDDPACSLRQVAMSRWGKEFDDSKKGGVPMHYPTHSLGGVLSVMPDAFVTHVSAVGFCMPGDDWYMPGEFSNETALFRVSNGATLRICEYRRIGHYGREGFKLFGTAGGFTDGPGGCHWVTRNEKERAALTVAEMRDPLPADVQAAYSRNARNEVDIYGGHGGSHAYLVHEFVSACAARRQPAINAWVSARFFAPGIMAHKSALKDGERLAVPDWGHCPN